MKKYLMGGIAALTLCAGFTSCSHDDFEPMTQAEIDKAKYDQAFLNYVGGKIAADQDWGFGSATTRAAYPNSNMWEDEGYVIPADITEDEIQKVLAVFNQKGEEHYESLVDWDEFFVQQVWKGTAEYTAGNGGTVVGGNQMNWLCAGSEAMGDDHVNNFNNAFGSIMLMINSSTQRFGYSSSTDNGHVFYYFRMEYIDGAYYVGFDFSAEGQNPNEQVQRDFIYNDWIVKIVPGKGQTPGNNDNNGYDLRIIAEDLSAQEAGDFDFNDVVFDVKYDATNAKVLVRAAGGTLPLTVNGVEVHGLLGAETNQMVNTNAADGVTRDPVEIELKFGVTSPETAKNIVIKVYKNDEWQTLEAEQGQPAAKMAVSTDFQWLDERASIKDAYPGFIDWVVGESRENRWW